MQKLVTLLTVSTLILAGTACSNSSNGTPKSNEENTAQATTEIIQQDVQETEQQQQDQAQEELQDYLIKTLDDAEMVINENFAYNDVSLKLVQTSEAETDVARIRTYTFEGYTKEEVAIGITANESGISWISYTVVPELSDDANFICTALVDGTMLTGTDFDEFQEKMDVYDDFTIGGKYEVVKGMFFGSYNIQIDNTIDVLE